MEFHILGPIEIRTDDQAADLGATKVRGLLGVMLLAPNTVVGVDTIVGRLWDEPSLSTNRQQPTKERGLPPRPEKTLQIYVTRLRDALEKAGAPARLTNEHHAYRLHVDPDLIDYHQFQQLASAGRQAVQAGDLHRAVEVLTQALTRWQGPPLADLATTWARGYRETMVARELLPTCYRLFDTHLKLGEYEAVLEHIQPLIAAHDTDETLAGQWMQAVAALDGPDKLPPYFRSFTERVRLSLQAEPSTQLVRLYERLTRQPSVVSTAERPITVPRLLPRPSPYFAGRAEILTELDRLMLTDGVSAPVVVIDGIAGVGKTETIVQWATRQHDHFSEGDLYINLNGYGPGPPLDTSTVLTTFLNALQLPAEHLMWNAQDRSALLRHTLTGRRILIVLDNVHDSEHARPLLDAIGSCPVIITSRQQLTGLVHRDGAQRITLNKLTSSASITLLNRRIGELRAGDDQSALRDLASLCDGLPIGLRMVAESIAASPYAPIWDIVDNLVRHRRLLLDTGSYGDDNSTTLRAVFASSCDDLDPEASRLYRLLGLHPTTVFSMPAAAALVGCEPEQIESTTDILLGAHLVDRQSGDRFELHDLLHLFAAELSDNEPLEVRTAALQRLLDWYLGSVINAARQLNPRRVEVPSLSLSPTVMPQIFDDEDSAAQWCMTEYSNILAASTRAHETGFHEHCWRLIGEFDDALSRYGDPANLIEIHHIALASARLSNPQNGAQEGEAGLLNNLAHVYAQLGDYGQATGYLRQAQVRYGSIGNAYGEAVALMNIATMYMERGNYAAAISLYSHSVGLFKDMDNSVGRAHAYHRLADTLRRMGRYDQAADYYQQALRLRKGTPRAEADTLTALGELQLQQNNPTAAIEYCEEALTFHRRALDTRRTAQAFETLAAAYCSIQQYVEAVRCGSEARKRYQSISYLRGEADSLVILGTAHHAVHDDDVARECWAAALELFQKLRDPKQHVVADYLCQNGAA